MIKIQKRISISKLQPTFIIITLILITKMAKTPMRKKIAKMILRKRNKTNLILKI